MALYLSELPFALRVKKFSKGTRRAILQAHACHSLILGFKGASWERDGQAQTYVKAGQSPVLPMVAWASPCQFGQSEVPSQASLSRNISVMRIATSIFIVTTLLLVGCNSSDEPDNESNQSPTAEPSPTALFELSPEPPESADPYAPNIGETSLTLGQSRNGQAVDTTLHEVRFPMPPDVYREASPGNEWFGLRLTQCLDDDADAATAAETFSTHNGDFSVVTPRGNEYSGDGSSWTDWPTPKFPETKTLIPGRCIKGWLALEVPVGLKVQSIVWRPGGHTTAEWMPKG